MKPPAETPKAVSAKNGADRTRAKSVRAQSRQALEHELQVHQAELEQQNEELRAAQHDLASAHDRYVDLFDFAPVGYLTLDREGRITEANLTATAELGIDRRTVLGSRFQHFVGPADTDRWQRLKALVLQRSEPMRIELRLRRHDSRQFHAQVDCVRVQRIGAKDQLRVTITDVSQRKLAEMNRRIAISGSLARESERRRIAQGLHEDLGQRLSALKMSLVSLAVPTGPPSLQATVDSMASQLDEALALVRRMSTDLHPLILDNLGLSAALDWLVSDVSARRGLMVELHSGEDAPLDASSKLAVYRLAEGVLEHLARHQSGGISMELLQHPHDIVLQFHCKPRHTRPGSQPNDVAEPSEGLMDQVHLLEGRLEVEELAHGMRRISIFVPIRWPADH